MRLWFPLPSFTPGPSTQTLVLGGCGHSRSGQQVADGYPQFRCTAWRCAHPHRTASGPWRRWYPHPWGKSVPPLQQPSKSLPHCCRMMNSAWNECDMCDMRMEGSKVRAIDRSRPWLAFQTRHNVWIKRESASPVASEAVLLRDGIRCS